MYTFHHMLQPCVESYIASYYTITKTITNHASHSIRNLLTDHILSRSYSDNMHINCRYQVHLFIALNAMSCEYLALNST